MCVIILIYDLFPRQVLCQSVCMYRSVSPSLPPYRPLQEQPSSTYQSLLFSLVIISTDCYGNVHLRYAKYIMNMFYLMHHLYIFILSCICYLLICLLHSCKIDITNFLKSFSSAKYDVPFLHQMHNSKIQDGQTDSMREKDLTSQAPTLSLSHSVCLFVIFFLLTPSLYLSTISLTLSKFVCLPVSYELCLSV